MVNDGAMRASDSDREGVVEVLRAAYTEGRLSLDEFDDRTAAAYSAKTWGDLRSLTSDLPAGADLGAAAPAGEPAAPKVQESMPVVSPSARRTMAMPFLPIAFFGLILVMTLHASVVLVPAIIMLLVWGLARRGRGPSRGPQGGFPREPGGSIPPRPGGIPPRTGGGPA